MITIRIPQSAFGPGGPLEGADPKRAKVAVFQSSPDGTWRNFFYVDVNGVSMPDIVFESSFYGERRDLCEFVTKGVLEVLHNGTPLTVQDIRDFHA